jgi:hypothetical protein
MQIIGVRWRYRPDNCRNQRLHNLAPPVRQQGKTAGPGALRFQLGFED